MNPSVEEILRNHYVDGLFHTHVSMVQPRGKFQFNRQGLEFFWDAYCKRIMKDENAILGIAEIPGQYIPVIVDIDLKYKDNGSMEFDEHLYTPSQAKQLISIYQSVLRNIVEDCSDDNLLCILLEKPIYYISAGDTISYIKNGFHLHFPNLFLSKEDQAAHLIPRVQAAAQKAQVFANLEIDPVTAIDKASCRNPWLMYGSRKSEDMDPYVAMSVVLACGKTMTIEEGLSHYQLFNINEDLMKIKGRIREYLPRILSIRPYGRRTYELKRGLISPLKERIREEHRKEKKNVRVSAVEALKISKRLLPLLDDFRTKDYNEWMKIGWVLYNIGDGSPEALEQWLEFSARCEESYDEGVCLCAWEKMVKRDYTLGTLKHHAKKDSPEQYRQYVQEATYFHIKASLNGSHNDIAKAMYSEYGDEFVCASISNKLWFQFRNHRWEEIEEGVDLRSRISGLIATKYLKLFNEITAKFAATNDKAEENAQATRSRQIQKVISNLKSAPYKNNIMKEAMEVFYDRRFKDKLNRNPYLIGFRNGVYDLKTCKFRSGYPEDFISKCTPIDYIEYNEADEQVQQVKEFLQKVFPDRSIRTYFLDTYSDIFVGGNLQKKVYLWTGEGDNGKSVTQAFFEKMLGELAIKFNTQYFTGKKTSTGAANPELARAGPPVRHATMEEPDADERLNIGELKKLSGGDSYWARDLFEKGKSTREVFPMFTLTFICNKLPKLRYSDTATWNRLRVIPFESTFVEPYKPCPKTLEEQMLHKKFPMDKGFSGKIPEMVKAFAWYLLQWRQKVKLRIEPEKVLEATATYRRQNDVYRQFIEECITEDDSKLSLSEMYAYFKMWYKESHPNMSPPIKNDVKEYFIKLWGDPQKGCRWHGYRIFTDEETLANDVANGSVVILDEEDLFGYNGTKPTEI